MIKLVINIIPAAELQILLQISTPFLNNKIMNNKIFVENKREQKVNATIIDRSFYFEEEEGE